jgi:phosphate transport system substrate-binding protein
MKRHALLIVLLSCTVLSPAHAVDARYGEYSPRPGLAGEASVAGAPAPASLMLLWPMSFHMAQPQTALQVGAGSGVKIKAAVEAIAILVHEKNPLSCISRDGLKRLYTEESPSWDMAGGMASPVVPLARKAEEGESDFFAGEVLAGAPFAGGVSFATRYSELLDRLAETPGGIGYAPAGYRGKGVKALRVSDGGDCVAPSAASAYRAEYPLARFVYLRGGESDVGRAFLDYVLSQAGQRDAVIAGFYSLPYVFAVEERGKLGLD